MKEEVFISIIVPVFNTEQYLVECIESIMEQEVFSIEVLLINDGSTDNSPNICDYYSNKYDFIKVVHRSNGGLSDARNYGINISKGKYILFIDSDDFIEKNSLKNIIRKLESSDIDLMFLETFKYYNPNKIIPIGLNYEETNIIGKSKKQVIDYLSNLPKFPASAWAKVIRKSIIIENNIFFEKGLICEDLEWSIRLFLAAEKFDYFEYPYYYYRQLRKDSITSVFSIKKFDNLLYIIEKYSKYDDLMYKDAILSFMSYEYSILIMNYTKLNKVDRKSYIDRIKGLYWIMDFRNDKKNILIKKLCKYLGFTTVSYLLRIYLYFREIMIRLV